MELNRFQPADLKNAHEHVVRAMMLGHKIDVNKIEDPKLRADLLIYKMLALSKSQP
jgi:hypothetical protein